MITHVVLWKFKPGTEADQERFLSGLRSLLGVIPEIKTQKIHRTYVKDSEFDALLVCTFDSKEALERYRTDPRHVAVADICKGIRVTRSTFDYES